MGTPTLAQTPVMTEEGVLVRVACQGEALLRAARSQ
jgi:hypothetical protein